MLNQSSTIPKGWLAFELNILRRLKYETVIFPFTGEPKLGAHLKTWNARILTNDFTQSAHIKAVAQIQNNHEVLFEEDVEKILDDVYIPAFRLQNSSLENRFSEVDAWWFDNIRKNIEKISSPIKKAVALNIAMNVGDYVLSFDEETREFRQPLSLIFKRLTNIFPVPFDNKKENICQNQSVHNFIAENQADLMFLRLPQARNASLQKSPDLGNWREEWLLGKADFWEDLEKSRMNNLGTSVESKSQYLKLFEDALNRASHIETWAIAHVENGFISTQDIIDTIGEIRSVDTVFTKDLSELTGTKAVIITA